MNVEVLASLDARELDGAQLILALLVVADHARYAVEGGVHGDVNHGADQLEVGLVGRCRATEIAGLLDKGLVGPDLLGKLLAEPVTHLHAVESDVAEGIALHVLALGLELGHDFGHAGAFADEDRDGVILVHHRVEAGGLLLHVDVHLGDVDRVDVLVLPVEVELGQELEVVQPVAPGAGRGGGEPAAVPAHDFVDDQLARGGGLLVDHVFEEHGAVFGRRPGAQRLADRHHVIVDGLGQADDGELIAV